DYWQKVGDYASLGDAVAAAISDISDNTSRIDQNESDITAVTEQSSISAAKLENPTGIELTFDDHEPGDKVSPPTGWRGGNENTKYIDPLDSSRAAYGRTDTDAGNWYTAKCFRITGDTPNPLTGSVQCAVDDGTALVMCRQ